MPIFTVACERTYEVRESMSIEVEADTPKQALQKARQMEEADELEHEWSETDGAADPESYAWEVQEGGNVVLTHHSSEDA